MKYIRNPEIRERLKEDLTQCLRDSLYFLHDTPSELSETILEYLEKRGWHGVRDDESHDIEKHPEPLHHSERREAEENGVADA